MLISRIIVRLPDLKLFLWLLLIILQLLLLYFKLYLIFYVLHIYLTLLVLRFQILQQPSSRNRILTAFSTGIHTIIFIPRKLLLCTRTIKIIINIITIELNISHRILLSMAVRFNLFLLRWLHRILPRYRCIYMTSSIARIILDILTIIIIFVKIRLRQISLHLKTLYTSTTRLPVINYLPLLR